MDTIHELFRQGKYDSIISKLTEHTAPGSLLEQLSRENSLVVCEYMHVRNDRRVGQVKSSLKRLTEALLKCSSIPNKTAILSLELILLCNYLFIHVQHRHEETTINMPVYRLINRTLYRVCSFLPGYERRRISLTELNPDLKSTCYAVLTVCLNTLQLGLECSGISDFIEPFADCCRMICFLAAIDKDHSLACTYLLKLQKLEENCASLANKKIACVNQLCLTFTVDHIYLAQSNKAFLTSFLIGCFRCMSDQWEDGIKHLEEAGSGEELKLASSVTSGYVLYRLQRYSDAISILLETIRSNETMTQRLKASIYNLIGMCFDKMGKSQLSIQMYKEALLADFGFLRPLFNTSLQYRKLEINDVELECLNLLVTALEMREERRPTGDGINLLDLLRIHDEDITYVEALYTFANRSLQLRRYSVAADKYKDLLRHLQLWESQDMSSLPSFLQVHHEAILSLLQANQLTDCLSLCNKVISCYHSQDLLADCSMAYSGNSLDNSTCNTSMRNSLNNSTSNTSMRRMSVEYCGNIPDNSTSDVSVRRTSIGYPDNSLVNSSARRPSVGSSTHVRSSRKRKRLSDSFTEDGGVMCETDINEESGLKENLYEEDVVACKYKAEVLYRLGQHDSALASAQRAVDSISSYKKKLFTMKGATFLGSQSSPSSQRLSKRPRLITESPSTEEVMDPANGDRTHDSTQNVIDPASGSHTHDSRQTTQTGTTERQLLSLCDKLHLHSQSLTLEYELYTLMSKILAEINQPADAKHFQRLAAQIKPVDKSVTLTAGENV